MGPTLAVSALPGYAVQKTTRDTKLAELGNNLDFVLRACLATGGADVAV